MLLCFVELYCFTEEIVLLLRLVVALCCVGIVASMFACLLDLCGTMNRCLKVVKDYSFGNVITGELFCNDFTPKSAYSNCCTKVHYKLVDAQAIGESLQQFLLIHHHHHHHLRNNGYKT